ncbi:MAG: Gfo/Idh/MocA family oxidoreductase [Oscillospiraceae bacterium]|nr:Gfo/Idh/MocA family oxidoreductase [Oscillospiraceae bacterium]
MKIPSLKVGLIGSGAISGTYLNNMINRFEILEVAGCSDIKPERSAKRAEEYKIKDMTNDEILGDPEIKIVVNTTYPKSHYKVSKAALLAGKHVHSEKMMAVTLEEGKELVKIAKEKNLRIGMAPDTFLGGALQTARKLIDSGMIGEPFTAQAMVVRGYHADRGRWPELGFTQEPGGGIPFDMSGYYLHALVHLLGPVERATGFAQCRHPKRVRKNTKNPAFGEELELDTINSITGSLEFKSGVLGNITAVSEGFGETPRLEVYGTEGTLICPDPNNFGGQVMLKRNSLNAWGDKEFFTIPLTHGFSDGCCRGIGVADMAWGIVNDRPHRAHGDMGLHVFEIIHGIWQGTKTGKIHVLESTCEQPAPLASGYIEHGYDEYALTI